MFVGPTLRPEDLPQDGDIVVLPPVAQGDVYRVAQERPSAIGIVDGYFEGVLSVWHKEILWAMAEGIHVFGSASMGALRAAELHQFGMRGIGRIFEAYRAGELEDDDEVAVIHGPAETGYLALSEAMVNIREISRRPSETASSPSRRATRWSASRRSCSTTTGPSSACSSAPPSARCPSELAALRAWLPQGGSTGSAGRPRHARGDAGAAGRRARADAGRLRPGVDRGVGRGDHGCGGIQAVRRQRDRGVADGRSRARGAASNRHLHRRARPGAVAPSGGARSGPPPPLAGRRGTRSG